MRPLVRNSVIYGAGTALNRFLGLLLLPLFTSYLEPADYGIMAMLTVMNAVLVGLFSLGIGNSLGVCYFGTTDSGARREYVWSGLVLVGLASVGWLLLGSLYAPRIGELLLQLSDTGHLVVLSLAGLTVATLLTPLQTYLRLEERAVTAALLSTTQAVVSLSTSVYLVVVQQHGVRGILEGTLIGGSLSLLLAAVTVLRTLPPKLSVSRGVELVRVGYPSIFGLGAFFLIDWADRVMLGRMVGLEEVGVYSIGYSIGFLMVVLAEGAFGVAWPPYFMSFASRREEARKVFGTVFKYVVFGYGTLAILFFVAARPLIVTLTAPEFHPAHTVVGLVATAYLLKLCFLLLLPPLYFERKLHLQAGLEWGAGILNLALNLLLIPILHKEGAALATVGAYLALPLSTYWVARKYLTVDYDWAAIGRFAFGFVVVAAAATVALPGVKPGIELLYRLGLFGVFLCWTALAGLTRVERQELGSVLHAVARRVSAVRVLPQSAE